jgi:hypothetical protein
VSGMPNSQAGVAASVASASRQTGSTLGVAVTGSIVAGAPAAGLAAASHSAWVVLAACGFAILLLGYGSTSQSALATAGRVREMLDSDAPGLAGPGQGEIDGGAPGGSPGADRDREGQASDATADHR